MIPCRAHQAAGFFLCAVFAAAGVAGAASASSAAPVGDPAETRPRIGLALSGGGARGAAHIGVLRVLEQHRIPVDLIAGTSMGALVGGLYASGLTAAEIERVVSEVDWREAFAERIPRRDRSFRRKRDDDLYLVRSKPGIRGTTLRFPQGLLDGQHIDLLLKRLTLPVAGVRDFDSLSIPFRAVAADLVTGDAVVLARGDLALAMRASMSIPAVFAPRVIGGRSLVDGGVTDNLPIDVVRSMGADVVIAVDISTPPSAAEDLNSVLAITAQLMTLTSQHNFQRQVGSLSGRDVFIRPELGSITSASFVRCVETIPIGIRAAEAALGRLEPLALSPEDYAAHVAARGRPGGLPVVEALQIVNRSRIGDDVIAARLDLETGRALDLERLEQALDQVYGLELFESVYYDVAPGPDGHVLTVTARERAWGPSYLQGGVAVFEDFEGPNFNVALAYSRTAINRRNGEWRTGIQLGQEPAAFTGWFQPVDRGLRTFVHLQASAHEQTLNVFDRDGHKLSELGIRRYGGSVAVGREMGTWGEVRAGVLREGGWVRTQVGAPGALDQRFNGADLFAQVHLDELDQVAFPRHGGSLRVLGTAGVEALGSDTECVQGQAEGGYALTRGRYTAVLGGMFGTTRDDDAPVQNLFRLGGFTALSGLEQDELGGQHAALASAVFYRRMLDLNLLPFYLGGSAEYGNTFERRQHIKPDRGIASGSVFLGLDTPIGPVQIAYGHAEGGRGNYYVMLGQAVARRRVRLGSW